MRKRERHPNWPNLRRPLFRLPTSNQSTFPSTPQQRTMEYYPSATLGPSPAHPSTSPPSSFTGKTLVLPVVSHGNVGQLASDLLINTWPLARAGCLDHAALLPCVGCGAFSETTGGGVGGAPAGRARYTLSTEPCARSPYPSTTQPWTPNHK